MGFKDLKKKRGSRLKNLGDKLENEGGNKYKDDRFWYPQQDKAGNASAVIRFLPECDGEDMQYVLRHQHAFKGAGAEPNKKSAGNWLIELCPTTLGKDCPICEQNSQLWKSGVERKQNIARKRKRNQQYISNILVLKDPANSDNDGKVFLFRYGKTIRDLIKDKVAPRFEDEEAIDPFDFWDGANFKLRIYRHEGWVKYDKCEFESPSSLYDGDEEKLKSVYEAQYPLSEFIDEKLFKSSDELKKRLVHVVRGASSDTTAEDEPSKPASTVNEKASKSDEDEPSDTEEKPPWNESEGDEPDPSTDSKGNESSEDDEELDSFLDELMEEDD